jgi:transcription initiation factor TFIIB
MPPTTATDRRERDGGVSQERPEYPVCPECDGATFDDGAVHHELVCQGCGLVVDTHYIDHGPEWRAFSQSEYEERARASPTTELRHDRGLSTTIDWRDRDGAGNSLSPTARRRADRLRQWNRRVRTQRRGARTLRKLLGELGRMASALGVPDPAREVAATVCRRAETDDLLQGRSVEGVATAALYAACRQVDVPRSLDEVTRVARVDRLEVGRTYKHLARELGLELRPPHPLDYVERFCSALDLPAAVLGDARAIIERTAREGLLAGKSPTGYAAAAVLAAGLIDGRDPNPREVADVADVTAVTVRNRARDQLAAVGTEAVAEGLVGTGDPPPDWRSGLELDPDAGDGTAGPRAAD